MKTSKTSAGLTLILAFAMALSACVSSSKYKAAIKERDDLQTKVNALTGQNNSLSNQVASLNTTYQNYQKDCESTRMDYQRTKQQLDDANAEKKVREDSLQKMRDEIYSSLVDFIDKGVNVEYKNGFVYVSMEDNLLYKSGSAALGDKGKKALSSIAEILNEHPKTSIVVVGHTDTVKVKGVADNWSLSTERANGVVRVLRDTYKVDPVRMTSAGKGKYDPVASNSSPEGRAKNRRTEIIIRRSDLDQALKESVLGY